MICGTVENTACEDNHRQLKVMRPAWFLHSTITNNYPFNTSMWWQNSVVGNTSMEIIQLAIVYGSNTSGSSHRYITTHQVSLTLLKKGLPTVQLQAALLFAPLLRWSRPPAAVASSFSVALGKWEVVDGLHAHLTKLDFCKQSFSKRSLTGRFAITAKHSMGASCAKMILRASVLFGLDTRPGPNQNINWKNTVYQFQKYTYILYTAICIHMCLF